MPIVNNDVLNPQHLMAGWWRDYDTSCQPVDYSDSPQSRRVSDARRR